MPTLYLDCDGFFAAVEESSDPALWGRPVAVATTTPTNPGACIIAVNRAAKTLGVGKGERARDALAAVPELAIRAQRPERYVATHHAIARAVDSILPGGQSRSIDEISVDLAPEDQPEDILARVKTAIRDAVGHVITASCAIAASAYLAKTAAEANKPDAAVVWRHADLPSVYGPLNLDDLPGLGPATETRLRRRGIDSVIALYDCERAVARSAWGSIIGAYTHDALHARNAIFRTRPRQQITHGRVLEPRLRRWSAGRLIVRFVGMVTLHRCTQEGVAPTRLRLEVLGEHGRLWRRGTAVAPTNHEAEALRALSALWDSIAYRARENPMRFAVAATHLREWPPRQGELFARPGGEVQGVLDTVRARFGARAVALGDTRDPAPYTGVKISFEHIPSVQTFEWLGITVPQITPPPGA